MELEKWSNSTPGGLFKKQCIQHPECFPHHICIRETNESRNNDQRFCDQMPQPSSPTKGPKKITQFPKNPEYEN
ncbi:hypothetical protein TNCV_2179901 [Trichonephila clavipes]|uniref:Uncharacterized protein n=1 Tax=Trichonephila clavipes TaxID=2585209 RepID=A0A8X7B936_TRICX|nr:hypothetical protein TNCV_2179901 [Trichonephila clavipes]